MTKKEEKKEIEEAEYDRDYDLNPHWGDAGPAACCPGCGLMFFLRADTYHKRKVYDPFLRGIP